MGGDHGCGVVITGIKLALEANKKISTLFIVGDQAARSCRAQSSRGFRDHLRQRVVHAAQVVEMNDKPAIALRKRKILPSPARAELVRGWPGRRPRFSRQHRRHFCRGNVKVDLIRGGSRGDCDCYSAPGK